jgi:hypothetical protein
MTKREASKRDDIFKDDNEKLGNIMFYDDEIIAEHEYETLEKST